LRPLDTPDERPPLAKRAGPRRLHVQHRRTEVGEVAPGEGGRLIVQLENANAGERSFHVATSSSTRTLAAEPASSAMWLGRFGVVAGALTAGRYADRFEPSGGQQRPRDDAVEDRLDLGGRNPALRLIPARRRAKRGQRGEREDVRVARMDETEL